MIQYKMGFGPLLTNIWQNYLIFPLICGQVFNPLIFLLEKPKKKKLIKRLKSTFRLTILNESTYEEKFSALLTPMNVIIIFGVLLVVFGLIIYGLVALTPLKAYLVPDFTDYEYRVDARNARLQVDSLTLEIQKQERYFNDLKVILSGGVISSESTDSTKQNTVSAPLVYEMSPEEKALRDKLAKEDRFTIDEEAVTSAGTTVDHLLLFKPLDGTLSSVFDPGQGHFGIDLVAPSDAVVKSVLDGTVILASYTADGGNTLHIQHSQNLVSVYKHNSVLFRKTGDLVKAGESIAIIGSSGDESEGPHLHFELWRNGLPVNPLDYLHFED
jgi:hypothetical protein